jgi:hypothetical protein
MPLSELVSLLMILAAPQTAAPPQAQPDLSSPKATVTSLLAAFSRNDNAGMAKCIEGGVVYNVINAVRRQGRET